MTVSRLIASRRRLGCLAIAWFVAATLPRAVAAAPRAPAAAPRVGVVVAEPPVCTGDYAEDLSAMSPRARSIESSASSYSYAVRTSATYECVSYGSDGNLKRTRTTVQAYGTAFGYRYDGTDTLLVTNEHVAEWPAVTDDEHPVDGVAPGCKRTADTLKIVDDDHDDYPGDDIALSRVVVDPALDVAVLRAQKKLAIIPWRIGKSAALAARNAVLVKGFPLGEFQATNVGKVVSPYDHDTQGARSHDDFVIDALLTSGGSGSPVFAVSCRTGELELVGIFHARYTGASALNVVVAIDQVRDLLATLKRTPRPTDHTAVLDAAARDRLIDTARGDPDPPFFAVGSLVASLRVRKDGTLVFAVFPGEFPRTVRPLFALEDVAVPDRKLFGSLGAVYVGGAAGLHELPITSSEAEVHALVSRALVALRESAIATFDYREATRSAGDSRTAFQRAQAKKRAFERTLAAQRDAAQAILDLVGRDTLRPAGAAVPLADLESDPPPVATVVSGT